MNKSIERVIGAIADDDITLRRLLKRILAVYGLSGVLTFAKLTNLKSSSQQTKTVALLQAFKTASWICALLGSYPVLHKALKNKTLAFNGALLATTQLKVPPWVSTYLAFESVLDYIIKTSSIPNLMSQLSNHNANFIRQTLLCLLIPWLRDASNPSRAKTILFQRKTPLRDFVTLFALWNSISLYQYLKSSLYKQRQRPKRYSIETNGIQDSVTLNSRLFKDKWKEINEMTTSRSVWEKIVGCCCGENLHVPLKWVAWRQLLWALLNTKSRYSSNLQVSALLMFGVYVLDSKENEMFMRPGVLKYLMRLWITDRIHDKPDWQNLLFWTGANLSWYNKIRTQAL
ncbi:LAFA_0B01728g1_1 [Lachancea sp. 'fantastica']|nr:LAFA_0B01728g1_1 [Lachancea sp. 'fantastica']